MMEVKARNRNVLNQVCEVPGDPGAVVPQVSQSVCQSVTSPGGKVKQADHSCGPDQQSAWETMGQTSVMQVTRISSTKTLPLTHKSHIPHTHTGVLAVQETSQEEEEEEDRDQLSAWITSLRVLCAARGKTD
ncbi:uncharacterized protein LOC135113334 isoform X2 [Scylla paramamosain]|uniref:uncharacterized protein LOC135113334 isoform X2 n=1 Tax=Scylla paramamosain TaxID=85552 RepID=UPI003083C278